MPRISWEKKRWVGNPSPKAEGEVPAPSAADWGWSALAGLAGSTGLLAFYTAMSSGYMTVVAPVTAVMNALIPIVAGEVDLALLKAMAFSVRCLKN